MKKIFLLVLVISVCKFSSAQNAIPNPGFENWTNHGSYDDPNSWGTINSLTSILGVKTVTKATGVDVHSGTLAIHLESKTVPIQGTAPGIAAIGTINQNTQAVDGGVVYTKRPIALTGWYKYLPNGVDTGSVFLTLWKWNNGRVQVGSAEFTMTSTVSSYTQFTIPVTYTSANFPDSMSITLLTSNLATGSPVGTKLFIDDLDFVLCTNFTATAAATAPATCTAANGAASVNTANGAGGNIYNWSNSSTTSSISAAAGAYNVTVTDGNGCSATSSTTVSATNTTITSTVSSTTTTCTSNTGTATVTPTNGTASYTYLWNNSGSTATISGLGAGGYQVTITDANGCSGTATTTVTTPNGPSATNATTNVACHGDSTGAINVTVNGGTGTITYLWSNGASTQDISGVAHGSYSVTITDANNCSFSLSATVSEPSSLLTSSSTVIDATSASANDGSVTVTPSGGTPSYTFAWSAGNGTNLAPGAYCYTVTDANACATSGCDTVSAPSAINNISNERIKLYPNPANNKIIIETNSTDSKFSFSIFSLEGKLVEEKIISGEKVTVDVKHLPTGLYSYQLKNNSSGKVNYGKLQIER